MAAEKQCPKFHHPDTVEYLQNLTKGAAAKQPPLFRERGCFVTHYWREGGEMRCREVEADEPSGGRASDGCAACDGGSGVRALASAAEDGTRMRPGSRPDTFETLIREGLFGCGAKVYAAVLEALDAKLPTRLPETWLAGRIRRREKRLQANHREPVQAGVNALLAAECCIENNRRADFLGGRACRATAV